MSRPLASPRLWAFLAILIGLVVAEVTTRWLESRQQAEARQRFDELARRATDQLARRMRTYEYGLRGMRGVVITLGPEGLRRDKIVEYSHSRDQDVEFPGSRGYGFIRRVPRQDEAAFLARARQDGKPNFAIRELAPHDGERLVIQYIEPEARNREAVGLDIGSEANRRNAAFKAIATGKATLTHPITLVQAKGKAKRGFLLLLPAYRFGASLDSPDERLQAAYGLAYTPLVMDEILSDFDYRNGEFSLTLYDLNDAMPSLFFESTEAMAAADGLVDRQPMALFGREWLVEIKALPPFLANLNQTPPRRLGLEIIVASLLVAGGVYALLLVRARQRETLKASARLAAIVTGSNDAIIGTGLDGDVTDWNQAAETIFGYPAAAAVGRKLRDLIVPPELAEEDDRLLQSVMHGQAVSHFATRRRGADGADLDVSLTVSPIRDNRGRVTGVAKTIRDIRAEKAAERRILELNVGLERKVQERTANLEAAIRELTDFSYLASHDLRTPLRAIDGYSSLLLKDQSAMGPDAAAQLQRIRLAAQHMGRIIDDLVALNRLSRADVALTCLDLSALAAEVAAAQRAAEPERQVEVVIQPGLVVRADGDLMHIALTQLFDNAWKFTRRTEAPRVEFSSTVEAGCREFHVVDNGIGFDMAYAGRLFNAFQRLHTDGQFSGTGIGLAMVQRIVRKHGGDVRAEGWPGRGAAIHFSLPD